MSTPSGLQVIAATAVALEELERKIPSEQRGVLFERVFHRPLELAFAETWAERNRMDKLLCDLLRTDEDDPRESAVPRTAREWEVARLVAATVIQWLPTSIGCGFLYESFKRANIKFSYDLVPIVNEHQG